MLGYTPARIYRLVADGKLAYIKLFRLDQRRRPALSPWLHRLQLVADFEFPAKNGAKPKAPGTVPGTVKKPKRAKPAKTKAKADIEPVVC